MSKTRLLVGILISFCLSAGAQPMVDSLYGLMLQSSDTARVNYLNELVWELCNNDNEKATEFARQSISLSTEIGYQRGFANAMNHLGLVFQNTGAYDSSVYYLERALNLFEELNFTNQAAGCLNNLGITYLYQSRFDKALSVFYQSLETKKQHNDREGLSSVYNNIGIVYANLDNNDKALWYYLKSIEMADSKVSPQVLANTLNNVGLIYQWRQWYDSAAYYFNRSLNICEKTGNKKGVAATLSNLGGIFQEQGKTNDAEEYFQKSLAINEQLNDLFAIASLYNNFGLLYQQNKAYQRSTDYYQKALLLSREIGSKIQEVSSLEGLSKNFELVGDFATSLKYYKEFKKAQDTVFSAEKEKTIAGLREKFEAGQREQLIRQLNTEAELREYRLKSQKNWLTFSVLGALLISVFSIVMWIQRNQKHKAYNDLLLKNIENARIIEHTTPVVGAESDDLPDEPIGLQITENETEKEKYKSSALNPFQKEIIYNRIKHAMTVRKLYLQPEMTIEKLAAEIKTNKSYISQVINETENQNFSAFLNDHRIREARRLIIDSENGHLTIETIARMVGFNSKSAFNGAFKKFTGLTPTFFIKNAVSKFDEGVNE